MDREADIVPSSPTISSLSSSDLDTESTGSFFHDRSTSLGTLMGVSIPEISAARPARMPSRREHHAAEVEGGGGAARKQRAAAERRRGRHRRGGRGGRRWWMLCREEDMGPTSLGEFLQVERRLSNAGSPDNHFFYGGGAAEHEAVGGGALFENGRVLPPPQHHRSETGSLGRLPVLLTGICSGGEG
ncbi:hypothetical protein Taro_040637 [Colocasia esculenta]|uniref:Uncharacterized protein n=1 Tax=Colocasia esculenta TaxID=4460 RepID=A0A843W9G7_COLES|nr:hypothetical protein [Colocasia esculenta]